MYPNEYHQLDEKDEIDKFKKHTLNIFGKNKNIHRDI